MASLTGEKPEPIIYDYMDITELPEKIKEKIAVDRNFEAVASVRNVEFLEDARILNVSMENTALITQRFKHSSSSRARNHYPSEPFGSLLLPFECFPLKR